MTIEITQQELETIAKTDKQIRSPLSQEGEAISKISSALESLTPSSQWTVLRMAAQQCEHAIKIQTSEFRSIAEVFNKIASRIEKPNYPPNPEAAGK